MGNEAFRSSWVTIGFSVVFENVNFHICSQARPRTRRVAHTEISNHTKTRIGSPSFRDRRLVYGHAESLIPKNSTLFEADRSIALSTDRSIDIEKKHFLSEATAKLPKNFIFNDTEAIKLTHEETSLMPDLLKKKSDRDHREIAKLTKKVDTELFSKTKKRHRFTNEKKKYFLNARFDDGRYSETKNEETERSKLSPVFLNFNDKSINDHSRRIEKSDLRPRHGKSKRNVKDRAIDSGIKKNSEHFDAPRTKKVTEDKVRTRKTKGCLVSKKVDNRFDKIQKWYKNIPRSKITSTKDNKKMEITRVSPFFEDYEIVELNNNKIDRAGRSSASYDLKKKLPEHNEDNKRIEVHEKCREKPPKNNTIPFLPRLKKREAYIDVPTVKNFTDAEKFQMRSDRFDNSTPGPVSQNLVEKSNNASDTVTKLLAQSQEDISSKSANNSTIVANKNSQKKTSHESAKNKKKKKSRSDSSSQKLQSKPSKLLASKTLNSTTSLRVEKRSNNTMWDFPLSSVIGKYFAFISSMLGVGAAATKNHPAGEETKITISPSVGGKKVHSNASATHISSGEIIQNTTHNSNRWTPSREEIKKTISSNVTDESLSENTTTDISTREREGIHQNSSKMFSENSTIINSTILKGEAVLNLTRNLDNSSTETSSLVKNSREAMIETDFQRPVAIAPKNLSGTVSSIALDYLRKIDSTNTPKTDNYTDSHVSEKLSKIENRSQNITEIPESKTNDSSNSLSSEKLSTASVRDIATISDIRSEDNEEKSSRLEELIKYTTITTGNLTKALREVVNDEYPEKTTLNFTIIDPNCTETFVQNSLANNSLDRSSGNVEVFTPVSTFPTIRRYSRNDSSMDSTVSTKNDIYRAHNNNAKNRQTKNSLSDYNSSSVARRGRVGGILRGRMRSRYKGKDHYPSIPRLVKNSWRRNNVSTALNFSVSQNPSKRPANIGASVLSKENRKFSTKPIFGGFPDSTTVAPPSADRDKLHATATEETIFYEKQTLTMPMNVTRTELSRPTGSTSLAVDDFAEEETKFDGFSKKATESVTVSSVIQFFTINAIRASPSESRREEDRIAQDDVTRKNISKAGLSSTISTILLKDNSIVLSDPTDVDAKKKIEKGFNEFDIVNSNREDNKESFAGGKIFEISKSSHVSFETKRHRDTAVEILDNRGPNESTTRSYNESNFAISTILNEIPASENKITLSEASSIAENEILSESKITPTTVNEFVGRATDWKADRKTADCTTEEKPKHSSVTKIFSNFDYSASTLATNEPTESLITSRNSADVSEALNNRRKIQEDVFSFEKEAIVPSNDSLVPKNHGTIGLSASSLNSSLSLENKNDVNYSSMTRHSDSAGREFFGKEEYVLVTSTETSPSLSSSNVVRKARDSRAISDYDEPRDPEFDYDIDVSAGIEPATEKTINSGEDDAEVPKAQERIFQELRRILSGYGALLD